MKKIQILANQKNENNLMMLQVLYNISAPSFIRNLLPAHWDCIIYYPYIGRIFESVLFFPFFRIFYFFTPNPPLFPPPVSPYPPLFRFPNHQT